METPKYKRISTNSATTVGAATQGAGRAASYSRQTDTSHRAESLSCPRCLGGGGGGGDTSCQQPGSNTLPHPPWRRAVRSRSRRSSCAVHETRRGPQLLSVYKPADSSGGGSVCSVCSSLAMTRQGDGGAFTLESRVKSAAVNPGWNRKQACSFKIKQEVSVSYPQPARLCVVKKAKMKMKTSAILRQCQSCVHQTICPMWFVLFFFHAGVRSASIWAGRPPAVALLFPLEMERKHLSPSLWHGASVVSSQAFFLKKVRLSRQCFLNDLCSSWLK